jgi:hypothetical protein
MLNSLASCLSCTHSRLICFTQLDSSHQLLMMKTEMVFETDMNPFFMQLISWEDFVLFSSSFRFFQHPHDPAFLETTPIQELEKSKQENPIYFGFFLLLWER